MVRIELETTISAPVERVFDLSRSVDLHMASTDFTGERAIAGVTSGCIGLGEQVTWRGRHFGLSLRHTSLITAYQSPNHFQDRMVRGHFRRFCHDHFFEETGSVTLMRDSMQFEAPCGMLGRVAEAILLERHLRQLLERRNRYLKKVAETDDWTQYLRAAPN